MKDIWVLMREGIPRLSFRGRATLLLSSLSQIFLAALDAIALVLLASIFQFTQEKGPSGIVLESATRELSIVIALFVSRSIISSLISWVTIRQMSHEESKLGIDTFSVLLNPTTHLDKTVETHFHNGVDRIPDSLMKFGLNVSSILSEVVTAAVLLSVFIYFDPITAFASLMYFLIVVVAQHRSLASMTHQQGTKLAKSRDGLYQVLADSAQLRKTLSSTSINSITKSLSNHRKSLSDARGRALFLSTLPRYLLEATLAIGLLVMGGVAYRTSGSAQALNSAVLFIGVSFRLMPVINRIQVLSLIIVSELPITRLILTSPTSIAQRALEKTRAKENALEMVDLNFQYPDSREQILGNINLLIEKGKQYAIVGPSGAGKTTLVDIFLGILEPTSGSLRRDPSFRSAYVTQDTHIAFTSLAENVALVWNWSEVDHHRVESALRRAGLEGFLHQIHDPTPLLNETLSGGQKQRIALARAFYSEANFVVLDEVTSSLDAETEISVVEKIREIRGDVTVVIITHRLSTVKYADHVFYIENGRLVGSNTFKVLADTLPQFRQQIKAGQIELPS